MPGERVSTEIRQTDEDVADDDDGDFLLDDCVVYEINTSTLWRTNSGQGYQSDVTMTACSMQYDAAKTIVNTIRSSWERQSFTGGGCKIMTCLVDDETVDQETEEGIWNVSLTLRMNHTAA